MENELGKVKGLGLGSGPVSPSKVDVSSVAKVPPTPSPAIVEASNTGKAKVGAPIVWEALSQPEKVENLRLAISQVDIRQEFLIAALLKLGALWNLSWSDELLAWLTPAKPKPVAPIVPPVVPIETTPIKDDND